MGKNDPLDRLLLRLPSEPPPGGLAGRALRYVQAKRRRRMAIHLSASLVLAAGGLWLSMPLVSTLAGSTNLSGSALTVLTEWMQVALAGLEAYVNYAWNGFTGMQSNLAAPISASAGLGLVAISVSVLLILGQLLPQNTGSTSKGARA
jgi:hypothetical protein